LSKLLIEKYDDAIDFISQLLETDSSHLHAAIGDGYSALNDESANYGVKDIAILKKVLSSNDERVIRTAVNAIRLLAKKDQQIAIDLLKFVDIGISNDVADEVLMLFQKEEVIPFRLLTEEDIDHFLKKLMPLQEINGYWIETFLSKVSKYYARHAAQFFMDRVEQSAQTNDWQYRPCNYGPYCQVPLLFRKSPECGALLQQISQWMKSREDNDLFQYRAGELFDVMFRPYDMELISFILDWIDTATPVDIRIISRILSEVPTDFVFQHGEFVMRFLNKAKQFGKECLRDALNALYGATISGTRKGIPGEPFPQDIKIKEDTEKALKEVSRFSPAYRLYEDLNKTANHNIARSIRERENYDE
jgi:hypothetical protein